MKKSINSTKSTSRRGSATFEFVKAAKDVPAGIMTAVYEAIKKAKRGTVAEIAAVAVKQFGLKKVTSQDPLIQTGVMLNRLKSMGSVKKAAKKTVTLAKKSAAVNVALVPEDAKENV